MRAGVHGHSRARRPPAAPRRSARRGGPSARARRCRRPASVPPTRCRTRSFAQSDVFSAAAISSTPSGISRDPLRDKRHMPVIDRPPAAVDDLLRAFPRPRQQLDRIEPDADEQVAVVDQRLLDHGIGENAREPRVVVGHDALRLVGHHRRHVATLAQARESPPHPRPGARQDRRSAAACARAARNASRLRLPRLAPVAGSCRPAGDEPRHRVRVRRQHASPGNRCARARDGLPVVSRIASAMVTSAVCASSRTEAFATGREQRRMIETLMLERRRRRARIRVGERPGAARGRDTHRRGR